MSIRMFLAPDDGQGAGGEAPTTLDEAEAAAQESIQEAPEQPEAPEVGQAQEDSPFFEISDEKGKPYRFSSPDELKQSFNNMLMLRGDYSRKTQELSEQRKQFEQEMQQMRQELEQQKSRYDKYNQFLERNPQVMRQLEQAVKQGVPPHMAMQQAQSYADKQVSALKEELESIKGQLAQERQRKEREEIFSRMKNQYEDFDEGSIEELMQVLGTGDKEKLVETLYFASKGRKPPAEEQRRMAEKLKAKQQGRLVPGKGNKVDSRKKFSSLEEAEAAAIENET